MRTSGSAVIIVLALVACGKKDGGGEGSSGGTSGSLVGSCDQRVQQKSQSTQTCVEYVGSAWTKKEVQARCGGEGQTYADGLCPTDGVVLSCVQMAGKPMEATVRFFGDAEKAKTNCAAIGTPK